MFFLISLIPDRAEAAEPEASLAALREPPKRAAGDDPGLLCQEAPRHRPPWPDHGTFLIFSPQVHKQLHGSNDNIFIVGQ